MPRRTLAAVDGASTDAGTTDAGATLLTTLRLRHRQHQVRENVDVQKKK